MYVVTVTFEITKNHIDEYKLEIAKQARNSLTLEEGCHQFDVCFDEDDTGRCFLYEKYTNRQAFDLHLASDHFKRFDEAVAPWIKSKDVQVWIENTGG